MKRKDIDFICIAPLNRTGKIINNVASGEIILRRSDSRNTVRQAVLLPLHNPWVLGG